MKTDKKIIITVESVLILYWLLFLHTVDSYYAPYLLVGIAGICSKLYRHMRCLKKFMSKREIWFTEIFAIMMSLTVTLGNYQYFTSFGKSVFENSKKILAAVFVLLGGFIIFREILLALSSCNVFCRKERQKNSKDKLVWFGMWAAIVILDMTILFGAVYPGVLSQDSMAQMRQLLNNSYSNHHPYYHTQIIHFWIKIGLWLFNDINKAVALYSCFSIVIMALCFVYVVETTDCITGNRKVSVILFIWYLIMPFHLTYSFTMWKDVFFGAAVTCMVVSVYRYLYDIGSKKANMAVAVIMSLGVCLLRSNGWAAFAITTVVFIILYKSEYKKLVFTFVAVLLVSFFMKHQVLSMLNVTQPDTVEALSIPTQQIARVVADGKKLSSEQKELLEKVVDIDRISETYTNYISDNIKSLIREKNNQDYIEENKGRFINLYFQLGLKYPQTYIKAWVDETRGYWNGGYDYWRWSIDLAENELGINRTVNSGMIEKLLKIYLHEWESVEILQGFVSIGLYTWIILFCFYNAVIKKKKAIVFIGVPFLAIIGTLMIATPVFAEFRYAYAIFCGVPFIIVASSFSDTKESS